MEKLTFASKVDGWLLAVILGSAIVCLVATAPVLAAPGTVRWPIALVILVGVGLPLWVLGSTRYTLMDAELRVRSGPFRWRVPLREVREITPTRDPLSSPALSLDRLRIDYGRGKWIMISPRDKELFIRELNARREAAAELHQDHR